MWQSASVACDARRGRSMSSEANWECGCPKQAAADNPKKTRMNRVSQTGRQQMKTMHRRQMMVVGLSATALIALGTMGAAPVQAQDKNVTIGIELPLTGADADSATRIKNGAIMGINDINSAGGAGGYKLNYVILDSG